MAWSLGGNGSGRQTGGTSLTVPLPAHSSGDSVFVSVHRTGVSSLSIPSGWTDDAGGATQQVRLVHQVRTAGVLTDPVFTTDTGQDWAYIVLVVSQNAYTVGSLVYGQSNGSQISVAHGAQVNTGALALQKTPSGFLVFVSMAVPQGVESASVSPNAGVYSGVNLGFSTSFRQGASQFLFSEADNPTYNDTADPPLILTTGGSAADVTWAIVEFDGVAAVAAVGPSASTSFPAVSRKTTVKELPYEIHADMLGSGLLGTGHGQVR